MVLATMWETLSVHFKQTYEGGYRYLDRCGEFMIAAEERMQFIPGDIKPTGAKLEIPEHGVNATCDANIMAASQELSVGDGSYFLGICKGLTQLSAELFQPKSIVKNGFAWKSYWPFSNVRDMLANSLKFGGEFEMILGKMIGMIPDHKKLDYMFNSGSKELHLMVQPVTFEKVNVTKQTPGFRANRTEKGRIDRLNRFAQNVTGGLSHALLLEVDLMENDPPVAASLDGHFSELKQKNEILRKHFQLK